MVTLRVFAERSRALRWLVSGVCEQTLPRSADHSSSSSGSSILEIDTPTSLIGSHQQQSTSILAIVAMTTPQTGKQNLLLLLLLLLL